MSLTRRAQWVAVGLIGAVCAGADAVVAALADGNHTIVQNNRAFLPTEVTIRHGETLAFNNNDEFIHQIYVDSPAMTFDSAEQPPGQSVKVTFPSAGDFPVRCHIHPKMKLLVHVK
ncbi:MAG TPA: cupredoxin domain-containing protein [Rhizomicrobium sp.]|jgi:plastocyanin|nr:cupredoxin domain-containing protein [Rhizomicrobium sp.]